MKKSQLTKTKDLKSMGIFTDINAMVDVIVSMLRVNDDVLVHQQKYDNHFEL